MDTIAWGSFHLTAVDLAVTAALPPGEFFPGTRRAHWEAARPWLAPTHWDPVTDRVMVTVRAWLLRGAGRTVLVDTGSGDGGDLTAALAARGVAPEDVDLVVCTHLHSDHVGGNTRGGAPAFPRARYLFHRADLAFFDPATLTEQPGRSAAVQRRSVLPVLRAGQADVWEGRHRIDRDLTLHAAPGHTPGHAVLAVADGRDRLVLTGDLLHSPAQLAEPGVSSCFCHDPAGAAATRRRVLAWAADRHALLLPAHLGGGRALRVRRDGERFAVRSWGWV